MDNAQSSGSENVEELDVYTLGYKILLFVHYHRGMQSARQLSFWDDFRAINSEVRLSSEELRNFFFEDMIFEPDYFNGLDVDMLEYFEREIGFYIELRADSPANSRDLPASSKDLPASSKDLPASSSDSPASSSDSPASSRKSPASSRNSPASSRESPASSRNSPASSRESPASSRDSPESFRERAHPPSPSSYTEENKFPYLECLSFLNEDSIEPLVYTSDENTEETNKPGTSSSMFNFGIEPLSRYESELINKQGPSKTDSSKFPSQSKLSPSSGKSSDQPVLPMDVENIENHTQEHQERKVKRKKKTKKRKFKGEHQEIAKRKKKFKKRKNKGEHQVIAKRKKKTKKRKNKGEQQAIAKRKKKTKKRKTKGERNKASRRRREKFKYSVPEDK